MKYDSSSWNIKVIILNTTAQLEVYCKLASFTTTEAMPTATAHRPVESAAKGSSWASTQQDTYALIQNDKS